MSCSCKVLATSTRGRIMHHGHEHQTYAFSLHFNNITQWMPYDDLISLEWNVRNLNPDAYFSVYPQEDRIHLKTPSPHLVFSFTPDELADLKDLLSRAITRLHWLEVLDKSIN